MNFYFFIAGILCFILGFVHSILGEIRIFKQKRNKGSLVPTRAGSDLKVRHLGILWATWHIATLFGWCLGVILINISIDVNADLIDFAILSIAITMFLASILVFTGTRARHPGWIVCLIIAGLLLLGI